MAKLLHLAVGSRNVLGRLSVTRVATSPASRSLSQRTNCVATAWLQTKDEPELYPDHSKTLGLFGTAPSVRYFQRKKIKVPPTKPLHFDYSGDLEKAVPELDLKRPKPGFDNVPELNEADEVVQKIFSLEFSDGRALRDRRISDLVEKVRDHPADIKSLETKIALQTILIRNQMRHILESRKDKAGKSRLVERIQSRKKSLRLLRGIDYEKFEWLLKELKIKYVPMPKYNRKDSKRAASKKLAYQQGKAIRLAKMEAFRVKLEEEKVKFLEFKDLELADIQQQLKDLGITEMPSLEETLKALGQDHLYERRPPEIKRRKLLLRKKFELYGLKSKKKGKQSVMIQ